MREVTEKVATRKPKYHGRIKCVECRRWMRPEPDAKTPLRRRPSPVASRCVECPVGLILESTRSCESADARREFDGFDVNEELCRACRALHEIDRGEYAERSPDALRAFAAECFVNIDEWLSRGGDLPSAWQGRFPFAGAMPSGNPEAGAMSVDVRTAFVCSGIPHIAPMLQAPDDNAAKRVTTCAEDT